MEPNLIGAAPQTVEQNEQMSELWSHHQGAENTFYIAEDFDMDMLWNEVEHFDIPDFPSPPPPPSTVDMGMVSTGVEPNLIGATPQTVEESEQTSELLSHHQRALSENTFYIAEDFDMAMLWNESEDFDIPDFPSPPPPPSTVKTTVDIGMVSTGVVDGGQSGGGEKGVKQRHQRNFSVDMLSTVSFQGASSSTRGRTRTLTPERLAAIALVDPKKAKRILCCRRSADKRKEKKKQHQSELEKLGKELEIQSSNLSARVAQLKKETAEMATKKKELEIQIQGMTKTYQLQRVLKQKTEEEMDLLRIQTAQNAAIIDNHSYNGLVSQFSSQLDMNQVHHYLPPQLQVPQRPHLFMPMSMPPPPPPPQQPQLFMPPSPPQQPHIFMPLPSPSSPPSGHPFNGEFGPDFSNYNEELADNSNRK